MPFKIKNWKLALLALCFFSLFIKLGDWQMQRSREKTALLNTYHQRAKQIPLIASELSKQTDPRFYRVKLTGQFDNQHHFLLDNKIVNGKIGYELYTPFFAENLPMPILIDRGFVPIMGSRQIL